jgi:hypothetical protein
MQAIIGGIAGGVENNNGLQTGDKERKHEIPSIKFETQRRGVDGCYLSLICLNAE